MGEVRRGRFIVFEGIDGSGKSTQAKLLYKSMKAKDGNVVLLKNRTDSTTSQAITETLQDGYINNLHIAALFIAEAYNVARTIKQHLDAGTDVICDRWAMSTVAYAGHADYEMHAIMNMYSEIIVPDHVVWLDIRPSVAIDRINSRGDTKEHYDDETKLERIRDVYERLMIEDLSTVIFSLTERHTIKPINNITPEQLNMVIWNAIFK